MIEQIVLVFVLATGGTIEEQASEMQCYAAKAAYTYAQSRGRRFMAYHVPTGAIEPVVEVQCLRPGQSLPPVS